MGKSWSIAQMSGSDWKTEKLRTYLSESIDLEVLELLRDLLERLQVPADLVADVPEEDLALATGPRARRSRG